MNSIQASLCNIMTHLESLSDSVSHSVDKHEHLQNQDKYILNRLDSIDTLLYRVSEIVEELDMTMHLGNAKCPQLTEQNHRVYDEKVKHYMLNKKIMKEIMPLYCALWIRYQ